MNNSIFVNDKFPLINTQDYICVIDNGADITFQKYDSLVIFLHNCITIIRNHFSILNSSGFQYIDHCLRGLSLENFH